VQAIDRIEDLLHRLVQCDLDSGYARDADSVLRLIFPMPTWVDYLTLAFDEIRQYGIDSLQVIRRLRAALHGLEDSAGDENRSEAVRRYLRHLHEMLATRRTISKIERGASGGSAGPWPLAQAFAS
jgi:uncharacterized membrane protein